MYQNIINMIRIFANITTNSNILTIPENEYHHLFNVLRARIGEKIGIIDGHGTSATAIIKSKSELELLEIYNQQRSKISLAIGILKNKAMDIMLRDVTAIGVNNIFLLFTDNSECNKSIILKKYAHWNNIMKEACKQSGNANLPTLHLPLDFSTFLKKTSDNIFVAALDSSSRNIIHYNIQSNISPTMLVGPEGDFSPREYQLLKSQKNVKFVKLSNSVLRSEVAAVYLLSIVNNLYEL